VKLSRAPAVPAATVGPATAGSCDPFGALMPSGRNPDGASPIAPSGGNEWVVFSRQCSGSPVLIDEYGACRDAAAPP